VVTGRRPSRRKRAALARITAERIATMSATQCDTADAREAVSADVADAARGYVKPKRRDTSRRCLAVTDGAWPDALPMNVNGRAASDHRRWRGETRAVALRPASSPVIRTRENPTR
jgi:hypothetical protein